MSLYVAAKVVERVLRPPGWEEALRATARASAPWYARQARAVETFVLITGYSRAGTTLLGALLNAHPEMVIANEADLLTHPPDVGSRWRSLARGEVLARLLATDQAFRRQIGYRAHGYSYLVPNGWQGRHRQLKVVGDKAVGAGGTCALADRPTLLDALRGHLGWQVRSLFVYRNPYDMVATQQLTRLRRAGDARLPALGAPLAEFDPPESERPAVDDEALARVLAVSGRLARVMPRFAAHETLAVRHEDLIASPQGKLREICGHLGVACSAGYLASCAAHVFPRPHRSRHKVRWRQRQIDAVAAAIDRFPWFAGYSFAGE